MPGFTIHACQWNAVFPSQAASAASEKDGVAKADIHFNIDGCDGAS